MNKKVDKKIDFSKLPIRNGERKQIDWKNSIGQEIAFEYKGIVGTLKITDYDAKNTMLHLLYNNNIYKLRIKEIKKCALGRLLGEFGYDDINIGLEKNNVVVTEIVENTHKLIRYKCKACGQYGEMKANSFKKSKNPCHICTGRKLVVGINDLHTTNPKLASMLKNQSDGYRVTQKSCEKLWFVCPYCGDEIYKSPNQINNSFPCVKCRDGHSYGERFMAAILKNKNIDFIQEKKFEWSGLKRYDFYLPSYNLIIETHGEQHYQSTHFESIGGRSLLEEQANDKLKKQLALKNKVSNYIVVDVQKSEFDYIKNNILNSELKEILSLKEEDFNIVPDMIMENNSVIMKKLRDIGFTIKMIADYMGLSEAAIVDGLSRFEKNDLFSVGSDLDSKIILINNMRIYNTVTEASVDTGVNVNSIINCCDGKYNYGGIDEKNRRMKWIYLKDYIKLYQKCR